MTNHGLSLRTVNTLLAILGSYSEVQSAILYGSRATGNYKPGSDIDLTLVGPNVTFQTLKRIMGAISDSSIPYQVDLSIYEHITDPDVRDHIKRRGILLYEAARNSCRTWLTTSTHQ